MTEAALVSGAGVGTGGRVDANFQPFAVDVIGQSFHVREFLVGGDVAASIAAGFPGVVDVDVDIAGVFHAIGGHGVGHSANGGVVDASGKLIPTVPAHRRSFGEAIVGNFVERRRLDTRGISAFASGRAVGDHFNELIILAAVCCDVEIFAGQTDLVGHTERRVTYEVSLTGEDLHVAT